MEWPILSHKERTQSNTYMPIICSVIAGFEVVFPPGYEEIFNEAIGKYNGSFAMDLYGKLEFSNFKTFQTFLKHRVNSTIGGLTREHFFAACDRRELYHMFPDAQTTIIGDEKIESFFGIFIDELKKNLGSKHLTCRLDPTGAHKGHHTREKRWYFINDYGEDIPYSDDDNRKIKNGEKHSSNPVVLGPYVVHINEGFQINTHTGKVRPIVFKGGKTKKTKRSRHRTLLTKRT